MTALKDEEKLIFENEERKRYETLWWAGALIWAGLVFGADSLGLLPQIGEADAWSWVFLGAGLYAFAGNLYRAVSTTRPDPTAWDWLWTGVFLILGLGGFTALNISWPLILLLVGSAILISTLIRR